MASTAFGRLDNVLALLIPRKAYLWAAAAALVAASIVYLRYDAVMDERRKEEARKLKQQAETHERIQDAISDPRTPDDIRRRLRELAE